MKSLAYLICAHDDSQLLESTHQSSLHSQTGCHAEGSDCAGVLCRGATVQANVHLMDLRFISPHSTPIYVFSIHLNLQATTGFFTTINFLTCKTKHNSNEKKKNLIINHLNGRLHKSLMLSHTFSLLANISSVCNSKVEKQIINVSPDTFQRISNLNLIIHQHMVPDRKRK